MTKLVSFGLILNDVSFVLNLAAFIQSPLFIFKERKFSISDSQGHIYFPRVSVWVLTSELV